MSFKIFMKILSQEMTHKLFHFKKRIIKNKVIIMDLTELEFDSQLEKLFEIKKESENIDIPKIKYKKVRKFNIEDSLDDTPEEISFDFESEFQLILNEGRFKKYMLDDSSFESPNSVLLKERITQQYLENNEHYSDEVEELLKVHLEFPSQDELILHKSNAWTNLKILLKILKENKGCLKLYNGIQFYRTAIIAKNGLKVYIEKLPLIVNKLKNILNKKVKEEVELIIILDQILTAFEKRVLLLGDYISCSYRVFDKIHLNLALEVNTFNETWTSFSHEALTKALSPYEFMISSLKKIIERYIGDPKHPKYIYINVKEEWAWYYLNSVSENGTRSWKLDVWMDDLSLALEPVLGECIFLYENLYNFRFQDRNYRKLVKTQYGIEEDLRILIKNIEIMSNRKRCSTYLRKHFSKKLKYTLTHNDIIDRRTPDPYIFNLYEHITQEEISKDWENICKRIYEDYVPGQ
jgi:hypothetical protein